MVHRTHLSKDKKLKKLVEAQEEYKLIRKKISTCIYAAPSLASS